MKIDKIMTVPMERCYATTFKKSHDRVEALFASEAIGGECISLSGENFKNVQSVWNGMGGTMSIVPIKNTKEFLAIQNFFPGYNSKAAKVVWVSQNENEFDIKDYISLPYLHRFTIIESQGIQYFVGCTLCTSKTEREDWTDPGKIYVGELTSDPSKPISLSVIQSGLTKNHGFYTRDEQGVPVVYVTSEEGVFKVSPPVDDRSWQVDHLSSVPTSELAIVDIDSDGVEEWVTIEPFHGDAVKISKHTDVKSEVLWEDNTSSEFIHALWSGILFGKPYVLIGSRRKEASLVLIGYNENLEEFERTIIETNVGCANLDVYIEGDAVYIASANHTAKHAAIYQLTNE